MAVTGTHVKAKVKTKVKAKVFGIKICSFKCVERLHEEKGRLALLDIFV